jgi:hypothetical protein
MDLDHFGHVIQKYGSKKLLILLDNLDRYNNRPDLDLVRRFFEIAQGRFQELREHALILITATAAWKEPLSAKGLSYIGRSSFMDLTVFDDDDVRKLLENRLGLLGKKYEDVFEPSAAGLFCQLAVGNPRKALEACSIVYQQAVQSKAEKIGGQLIRECFGQDLKLRAYGVAVELAKEDPSARDTLVSLHHVSVAIERAGGSPDVGWSCVRRLFGGAKITLSEVPEALRPILARLADLKGELRGGVLMPQEWAPSSRIKAFGVSVRKKGISPENFVDQYRLSPVPLASLVSSGASPEKKAEAELRLAEINTDAQTKIHIARAERAISRMGGVMPARGVLSARHALEHFLVAFHTSKGIPLPSDYIASPEDGQMVDNLGRYRHKFEWRLRKELADLLASFKGRKTIRFDTIPEMHFIQQKASAALESQGASVTDSDQQMVSLALVKVAAEFAQHLHNQGVSRSSQLPPSKG